MSAPEFGAALGIYTDEFIGANNFLHLHRHIHHSPSCCWTDLTANQIRYDASCLKETSLSPALRYIYVLLAHTLTSMRESTGVEGSHLSWSLRNSSRLILGPLRHSRDVIDTHIRRPDGSFGNF
ncbi:hypothetical protein PVK06_012627 [Gossypium arboreum]|uniref:Uncharacterized protein n=1 Tax=Gossypium arboreum TaxID=29729 RepID=A0ABR0QCF6_GOSAR|nr:hypothetical protein PVK06_012627 [Gossypium arboreum]